MNADQLIQANENSNGHEAMPLIDIPAGDQRREQAKVNEDFLAQAAEERAGHVNMTAIDPSKLRVENEIAIHFSIHNQLEVSHALPQYRYYWAPTAARGWMVTYLQAMRLRNPNTGYMEPIWQIVNGGPEDGMPEALENRDATGIRRIGDVLLMRCRIDHYVLYRRWERQQRLVAQDPEAAAQEALAYEEEAHRKGFQGVRLRVNDPLADPSYRRAAKIAATNRVAKATFDAMIRAGKVPGLDPRAVPGLRH